MIKIITIEREYGSGGGDAWLDVGRRQGRMARERAPYISIHYGAKLLDRDFRVVHMLSRYAGGEPDVGA